jgi:hypothetical protein
MSMRIRSVLYGLAAAAVFILAVGIAFADWSGGGRRLLRAPRVVALPGNLATDLFARHDDDEKVKNHQSPGITQTDFNTMGKQLRNVLGFPVLAASLPGDGWKFHGASICTVGKIVTAHLLFERQGKQYVSLFSMPVSEVSGSGSGCDYSEVSQNHVLAGFTTSVGFYCVVASSSDESMTIEEVRTIRDELKPLVIDVPPSPDSQLAAIVPAVSFSDILAESDRSHTIPPWLMRAAGPTSPSMAGAKEASRKRSSRSWLLSSSPLFFGRSLSKRS